MTKFFLIVLMLASASSIHAQVSKSARYPTMAPIEQYRIANRDDEIALARSAAPPSISADAEVLVLGNHGFETAVKGKNGFVCIVERSWGAGFENAEFWNPKLRSPICFNAPAAHSVVPQFLKRSEWVLAGASKQEMIERSKAAYANKSFIAPDPGSMCYMLSPRAYLSDKDSHWMPHLMFFLPRVATSFWGANLPASPIIAFEGSDVDPVTVFLVPVRKWSDGTVAPDHHVN
ncbi:hypothetical protein [Rudaea sp.]|uniref:hypothetical protein n=1 Tax=Rudaea sp. TaxID=2136325 RepID=UPI002ED48900